MTLQFGLSDNLLAGSPGPHREARCLLCEDVVVFNGPFGIARGTANRWLSNGGVAHTEHPKLGRQAIQVQADPVKVGIGGTAGERGGDRILSGRILRHWFLSWVQQDGIDVGQFPEHSHKRREFRGRACAHRSCYDFVLDGWVRVRVEGIENA